MVLRVTAYDRDHFYFDVNMEVIEAQSLTGGVKSLIKQALKSVEGKTNKTIADIVSDEEISIIEHASRFVKTVSLFDKADLIISVE